jgi:hypothetical protein
MFSASSITKVERRDYVIVDREGRDHALSKRITGANAAAKRQRIADVDRATLPSVDEAKKLQRAPHSLAAGTRTHLTFSARAHFRERRQAL